MTTRPAFKRRHLTSSPFNAEPDREIEEYAVDDRVTHDKYGLGRVTAKEAGAVIVDFGSQQVRVTSPFNRLSKL